MSPDVLHPWWPEYAALAARHSTLYVTLLNDLILDVSPETAPGRAVFAIVQGLIYWNGLWYPKQDGTLVKVRIDVPYEIRSIRDDSAYHVVLHAYLARALELKE